MSLAIAFTFEARVPVALVDSLSFQICEPRLDVWGWDEDRHSFIRPASFIARFDAGLFKLFYSASNTSPVGIDKHNQCPLNAVPPPSVVHKLLREALTDELLTRSTAFRADLDPLHPEVFACALQESPGERLVLPIFT